MRSATFNRVGQSSPQGSEPKPPFGGIVFEPDPESGFASADDLFQRLDGCDTVAAGDEWHLEIYGVIDHNDSRWVQVGVNGRRQELITVRLRRGMGADDALEAVRSALERDAESDPTDVPHLH